MEVRKAKRHNSNMNYIIVTPLYLKDSKYFVHPGNITLIASKMISLNLIESYNIQVYEDMI